MRMVQRSLPSDASLSLIIVARVPDTAYDSADEDGARSFQEDFHPDDRRLFKGVEKSWTLFDHLDDIIRGRSLALAKKTDGKKKRDVALAKGECQPRWKFEVL